MRRPHATDVGLAACLLATSAAHAQLYVHGYRFIPAVGPGFLILASTSAALAVLILAGGPAWLRAGAAVLATGAVGAFVLSRTSGLFGFSERGWEPAPYAVISVVAEGLIVALVVLQSRRVGLPAPTRPG